MIFWRIWQDNTLLLWEDYIRDDISGVRASPPQILYCQCVCVCVCPYVCVWPPLDSCDTDETFIMSCIRHDGFSVSVRRAGTGPMNTHITAEWWIPVWNTHTHAAADTVVWLALEFAALIRSKIPSRRTMWWVTHTLMYIYTSTCTFQQKQELLIPAAVAAVTGVSDSQLKTTEV